MTGLLIASFMMCVCVCVSVCVWWWSFMLRDWWEDRGKKKLQRFFVYRQTLWRRAKLTCIKMWVNLGQGIFSKGKLNKTDVRVTKNFEV